MQVKYPYKVKYSQIHTDIKLAWCDEGKGDKTFLFIHGLSGYLPLWYNQIEGLKANYRCMAIDLPGNGLSTKGEFPYSMFFYAESVAQFIKKEELTNVILCGHSMGGQIAQIVALRYPELIEKLVLIAPAGFEKFATHEIFMMEQMMQMGQLFYVNSSHLETTIKQSFFRENAQSSKIISDLKEIMKNQSSKVWNDMINASIIAMLREPTIDYIKAIQMPVTIIFGSNDAFIPNKLIHPFESTSSVIAQAKNLIPQCQSHLINNAGHFVHLEKAAEVNEILKNQG
jgi:pimeloyl-ACP methyl ester carboxylesterase